MDRTRTALSVGLFLGAILVAASVGGVVVGAYAAVQPDLGLCGTPTVLVTSPAETHPATVNGTQTPSVPRLAYDDLTEAERRAYDEALESPLNEGEVRGEFVHEAAFRDGAVVTHEGEEHYVLVGTMDRCVSTNPAVLPSSAVGLVLGLVLFGGAALGRRRER